MQQGNLSTDEAVAVAKSKDAVLLGSIGGNTQTSPWYKLPPNLRPEAGLLKIEKNLDFLQTFVRLTFTRN